MNLLWHERMRLENDDDDPTTTIYTPIYSENPRIELFVLGAVSLGLTIVNIISIFVAGILVLKVSMNKQHVSLLLYSRENVVQIYVTYQDQ
jgi:hypothetical protein